MAEVLAEPLLRERKPRKAEERETTIRLETIFREKGVIPEEFGLVLRRLPAAIFDDRAGFTEDAVAHDLLARLFAHNPRAEGLVTDAVVSQLARASLGRLPPSSPEAVPPPRPQTWSPELPLTPPPRQGREEARAAVRELAREVAAGNAEEPQPRERRQRQPAPATAEREQAPAQPPAPAPKKAARKAPPAPQPPQPDDSSSSSSSNEESSETEHSKSDGAETSLTTARSTTTHGRRLAEGTFRDRKVLYTPGLWETPLLQEGGPEKLDRELRREFLPAGPPTTFTEEIGELCIEVLLLLAGTGRDNEEEREQQQQDAQTTLMDMLVRVGAARGGATKVELEKLRRDIARDTVPKRYRRHLEKLEKKKERDTRRTPTTTVRRSAPPARVFRQANVEHQARQPTTATSGYIDPAKWATMSPAARAQHLAKRRR